jgi:RNAse (barnase) inhibitor barstar
MTRYSVDLSTTKSQEDLHNLIAQVFSFPDYYGRNWDAFETGVPGCAEWYSLPRRC